MNTFAPAEVKPNGQAATAPKQGADILTAAGDCHPLPSRTKAGASLSCANIHDGLAEPGVASFTHCGERRNNFTMRSPLKFFVVGIPKAQPRAKATAFGGFARVYNPSGKHDDWKLIVRNEAAKAHDGQQWQGPLRVDLTFYFPRPKGHFRKNGELKPNAPRWHTTKPDRDNSDKAILDTLTNLGIWGDDKQVCDGRIRKLYTYAGGPCGCEIIIQEAANE